jgi:hypothetical protein
MDFANFTEDMSFQSLQGDMQPGGGHHFIYDTPKPEDITDAQRTYIQGVMHDFEAALASNNFTDPNTGYRAHINVDSFVDYFLFTQFSGDVDAFYQSTFIVKDRNKKVEMGPLWDYNLAFGNSELCGGWRTDRWAHIPEGMCANTAGFPMPFWWARLLEDSYFTSALKTRWAELRSTTLATDHVLATISEIRDQLERTNAVSEDQAVWNTIGQNTFTNYSVGSSYAEEIDHLNTWVRDRLIWLYTNINGLN